MKTPVVPASREADSTHRLPPVPKVCLKEFRMNHPRKSPLPVVHCRRVARCAASSAPGTLFRRHTASVIYATRAGKSTKCQTGARDEPRKPQHCGFEDAIELVARLEYYERNRHFDGYDMALADYGHSSRRNRSRLPGAQVRLEKRRLPLWGPAINRRLLKGRYDMGRKFIDDSGNDLPVGSHAPCKLVSITRHEPSEANLKKWRDMKPSLCFRFMLHKPTDAENHGATAASFCTDTSRSSGSCLRFARTSTTVSLPRNSMRTITSGTGIASSCEEAGLRQAHRHDRFADRRSRTTPRTSIRIPRRSEGSEASRKENEDGGRRRQSGGRRATRGRRSRQRRQRRQRRYSVLIGQERPAGASRNVLPPAAQFPGEL